MRRREIKTVNEFLYHDDALVQTIYGIRHTTPVILKVKGNESISMLSPASTRINMSKV